MAGDFQSTASFGNTNLTSSGSDDMFVSKLTSTGAFIWTTPAGGVGGDYAHSMDVDTIGNVYIGGSFQ